MVELKSTYNGLEIILTDKEDFLYEFEDKLNTMQPADLLDASRYLGNGWDDVTGKIGLTEAPAIGWGVEHSDNGEVTDIELAYYYPNYMVENPWEILLNEGKVFFNEVK